MYKGNNIGYCVISVEEKFGLKLAWIMDLFIDDEFHNLFNNVLNVIADQYYLQSDFITSLLPNKCFKKYYLRSIFFKIPDMVFPHKFYFCAHKNSSKEWNIYNLENWYMTWSLNDVI